MSFHSSGIKYKRENFKALKDEIRNIKNNINEEVNLAGVFSYNKDKYIWRFKNKKLYIKSSTEEKYDLNEILKFYKQNKDKYLQGFTSQYFNKLTDLLSRKNKSYSKERLDLFKSRVNKSHKIFINKYNNNGEDLEIKSISKKGINPFMTSIKSYNSKNYSKRKNKIEKKNENKNMLIKKNKFLKSKTNYYYQTNSSNDILNKNYNDFNKRLIIIKENNNINDLSIEKNDISNINKNKYYSKFYTYKNMFENENNKYFDDISLTFNKTNYKNKLDSINFNEICLREQFFKNLDNQKYFDYFKKQYNFNNNSNYSDKYFILEDIKKKNIFKFRTNNKYLDKIMKNYGKADFFKRMKSETKKEKTPIQNKDNFNKTNYNRKITKLFSPQAWFLKTMKFDNDYHSIFEKIRNDIKLD